MDAAPPRLAGAGRAGLAGRAGPLLDAHGAIDALVHRRDALEREIVAMPPGSPWAVQVGRLRCLRGIDTLSAVGLCAEVGDFERFARAEQLSSYVGLVPSESTTGQQRRLGAITKTGYRAPGRPARRGGRGNPPSRPHTTTSERECANSTTPG